jgi:hypothetical protein
MTSKKDVTGPGTAWPNGMPTAGLNVEELTALLYDETDNIADVMEAALNALGEYERSLSVVAAIADFIANGGGKADKKTALSVIKDLMINFEDMKHKVEIALIRATTVPIRETQGDTKQKGRVK